MLVRILKAVALNQSFYEELKYETSAKPQALAVVFLSSLAFGIGGFNEAGPVMVLFGTITAVLAWALLVFLSYFIGAKMFPEPQTQVYKGELIRLTGFATAPGLIRVLALIPDSVVKQLVFFVAGIWMLSTMVVAIKMAFNYTSMWRAFAVCILGWVVQASILGLVFPVLGFVGTVE